MVERIRKALITALGVMLCLYTVIFVNYPVLELQSSLAIFAMIGLVIIFLQQPAFKRISAPADDLARVAENARVEAGGRTRARFIWKLDLVSRWIFASLTIVCFAYIFCQTEPFFKFLWPDGQPFTKPTSLGNRASDETATDFVVGVIGILLVLEATRRTIGWIVPALAILFMCHAFFAASFPDWMFPHPGLSVKEIVSKTFLQSQGVLGQASKVMFQYVFLFVVFGAFLEMSGATRFIIDFSEKLFGRSAGGPAKIAVLGSGLMGSLSGSAVANAVTTGSFTIPMMRSAGFQPHIAGGITAAAATGGALVPPVMGAGAYMMLDFVVRPEKDVTFLEIARAALIPAVLYYFSLFMIVHFFARKTGDAAVKPEQQRRKISAFEAAVFFSALGVLIGLLFMGQSPFKSVTGALVAILVLAVFRKELQLSGWTRILAIATFAATAILHQLTSSFSGTGFFENNILNSFLATSWTNPDTAQIGFRQTFDSLLNSSFFGMLSLIVFGLCQRTWRPQIVSALSSASKNGVALIAASACVGIIIGIVDTTPVARDFSAVIGSVVESNLLLALVGIMAVSLLLGMGVPSVVCYILVATLMGDILNDLGVDPLAAHLFIFYFGMMSMVTPPVALAAYASASIAKAPIMKTAFASFRFSLIGFTLPYMFIYRPELLLMGPKDGDLLWYNVVIAIVAAVLGIVALAAAVTGFMHKKLNWPIRGILTIAAILLLAPNIGGITIGIFVNLAGAAIFAGVVILNRTKPSHH